MFAFCSVKDEPISLQIFIHNPSSRGQKGGRLELAGQGDLSLLNINQVISAVKAGQLDRKSNQDILVVGTQTNILAFDVTNNKDIFFKEVRKLLHSAAQDDLRQEI